MISTWEAIHVIVVVALIAVDLLVIQPRNFKR